jgi:DNA modification methylase
MMPTVKILQGDAIAKLKELPNESVHCVVTSPPYWGLRDYSRCPCVKRQHPDDNSSTLVGSIGGFDVNHKTVSDPDCPKCHGTGVIEGVGGYQLGLEKTPEEYVQHIVEVSKEVWRVLREDGIYCLNLGDSFWGGKGKSSQAWSTEHQNRKTLEKNQHQICGQGETRPSDGKHEIIKPKDLVGIPWRVAFALQADGWYLRSDIIWNKLNPMPESVTDRPTKSHEYIFLLTKSPRYFYDQEAVREESPDNFDMRRRRNAGYIKIPSGGKDELKSKKGYEYGMGRNIRSVWTIATKPYKGAHFATFPEAIPETCIKAGTSEKGCCPRCGSQWTRITGKGKRLITEAMRNAGCDGDGSYTGEAIKNYEPSLSQNPSDTKRRILESMSHPTLTLGWKPTCECYGVEIIEKEPKEPYESSDDYEEKHHQWEIDVAFWHTRWDYLKLVYNMLEAVPCVVLDPFAGSGTTGAVAKRLGRSSVLIELNPEYIKLIEKRLEEASAVKPNKKEL